MSPKMYPTRYEGYGPTYIRVSMRDVPDAHFDPEEMKRTVDAVLEALADNKSLCALPLRCL